MNKKGLEFKLAFFALIVASMLFIAIGTWINDWNEDYGTNLLNDLDEYNKLSDVSGEVEGQQDKIVVKSVGEDTDFESTSIRGVFGVLNNIYAPFRVLFGDNGMLDSITERIGLPDYVRQGLVLMMIVAITFALVAIFFRLPRRSA